MEVKESRAVSGDGRDGSEAGKRPVLPKLHLCSRFNHSRSA